MGVEVVVVLVEGELEEVEVVFVDFVDFLFVVEMSS
jgi:hypothetical protein